MNPNPDLAALVAVLARPQLPELAVSTIEVLASTFSRMRELHPDTTAQQFLEQILLEGVIHHRKAIRGFRARRIA